jgi:hypothetical protein
MPMRVRVVVILIRYRIAARETLIGYLRILPLFHHCVLIELRSQMVRSAYAALSLKPDVTISGPGTIRRRLKQNARLRVDSGGAEPT